MDSHPNDDTMMRLFDTLNTSDDTDPITQLSLVIDEIQTQDVDLDDSTAAYSRWLSEIIGWMVYKISNDSIKGENDLSVKRDDRLADAVCHAAYRSFQLVIEQIGQPDADCCFSAKNTIKSLSERILASCDLLCKNMSVENSWQDIHLKNNIIKTADLATEYINSRTSLLQLPEDLHEYDDWTLQFLKGNMMPNSVHEDTATNVESVTKALDDDLVGLGRDLVTIMERLIGTLLKLDIIQIVGMGGIGKTTLARRVYEDPQIMFRFHVRAWVTISQDFRERDALLGLLQSVNSPLPEEVCKEDKEQLAERLYRRLKGWRYFIVIDDIWAKEAWDHMKLCFPDDNNGSRIILTSRLTEVASYVNPEKPPHSMNFLGPEDSWELLHKNVFGKESCPPQLVNVGKRIAEKCQGLPLAVKVVAGHLSNINTEKESWENVAEKVDLTEVTQMESLLNTLSISYDDLPQHLKACFLTLAIFPKNFEIPVRKLIRLWTAMGFLYSNLPESLEEVAMKCLGDLISRSLIMVRNRKINGKVKSCGIHDLLWDLSIREARKEGEYIFGKPYLSHSYFDPCNDSKYVMGLSRILLYSDHSLESEVPLDSPQFKLLTVLDILNQSFDHFPDEVTDLVNLRYLALAVSGNVPGSVSKLRNLETFIIKSEWAAQNLPKEIWLLAHLRHLHVGIHTNLSDPISGLPNLQELSIISSASCTEEVLLNIPNLVELTINHKEEGANTRDELFFNCLNNLVRLQQLEKLMLYCTGQLDIPSRIPQWEGCLPNIKHLTLSGTCLLWNEMNSLARLPNLEVLKLKRYSFLGPEWVMNEEFLQLKCLQLESLDLAFWKANQDHFPNLQSLAIRNCVSLSRIPSDFAEISTLHLIDMDYCNYYTCESAREIQIEQLTMGNDQLIVRIGHMCDEQQILGIIAAFVYLNSRLEMAQDKHESRKTETETDPLENRGVLTGECSSSLTLAKDSDEELDFSG